MPKSANKKRILTGDRPSGRLHLGHYVGSLENRLKLQNDYDCFFIIADYEYLTDNIENTAAFEKNISDLVLDYLSVGIDPDKCSIFVESQVPQIAELNLIFSMMVKMSRVVRNPTIKDEIKNKGVEGPTFGYIGWPIIQAADILCVRADVVPVGEDQLPHVEQTREIARYFNSNFQEIFTEPEPIVGSTPRLLGPDGRKMSKSLGNAIYLSDSAKEVEEKISKAVTDPKKIKKDDPGDPEICNIYKYYQVFAKDLAEHRGQQCREGKIGCVECKKEIAKRINEFLDPIRERRAKFEKNDKLIAEILAAGNKRARAQAQETLDLVKRAMKLDYKNLLK